MHNLSKDDRGIVRSQLFVPGNRPDRFEKACLSQADLVCIDLEDAVADAQKAEARDATLNWLEKTHHKHVGLRINAIDSPYYMEDIAALSQMALRLPFVMLPKVGALGDILRVDTDVASKVGPFFAIAESAAGVMNCTEIFSHPRVAYGMYGAIDYAGEVGCDTSWETHLWGRCRLVAAANMHDVTLFDTPHIDVRNLEDCEFSTRRAKTLGIYARSAIHPAQIDVIHHALAPTKQEIESAQRIVKAYSEADGNVVLLDGRMVEKPVVANALRVLKFANLSN